VPLPLLSFAPFYAILYRRASLIIALWISAGCGFILDFLSVGPFGTQTLIAVAAAFFLHRYRIYFVDKPVGLLSYTLILSIFLTLLNRISYFLHDPTFPFTLKGFATDFLLLPLADALYALLFFSYPLILYRFLKKQWFRFHFLKKESRKKEEESIHGT
jgi:rod shape-determining protein MreD